MFYLIFSFHVDCFKLYTKFQKILISYLDINLYVKKQNGE